MNFQSAISLSRRLTIASLVSTSDTPRPSNCFWILNKNFFLASSGAANKLDKVNGFPSFVKKILDKSDSVAASTFLSDILWVTFSTLNFDTLAKLLSFSLLP